MLWGAFPFLSCWEDQCVASLRPGGEHLALPSLLLQVALFRLRERDLLERLATQVQGLVSQGMSHTDAFNEVSMQGRTWMWQLEWVLLMICRTLLVPCACL